MDIQRLHDAAMTAQFGFGLLSIATIVAGMCLLAFIAGLPRLGRKSLPQGFPADPEAARTKYVLAFAQLLESQSDDPEYQAKMLEENQNQPALRLSANALAGASKKSLNAKKADDRKKG